MDAKLAEISKSQSPKSYLYTTIARTHLGEVASSIISCLIANGRLTSRDIAMRTHIPMKSVKSALVSLIQLNCIYYWNQEESVSSTKKAVYYSVNETGLLLFVHAGDIINHIKKQFGDDGAEIVQNILMNGHVKVSDYLGQYDDMPEIKLEKQSLFFRLFNERWLTRLQPINYHPLDDIWNKIFQECLKNTPRSTTTSEIKRVAEAKESAKVKLTQLLEEGHSSQELYDSKDGIKKLQPHLVVCVNLARFQKHLRTQALVNLAKSRIGILSAKIYEVALKIIEQNSPELRNPFLDISGLINDPEEERNLINLIENKLVDEKKIVVNIREIVRLLPDDIDLRNSILTHNFLKPQLKKRPLEDDNREVPEKKIKLENEGSLLPLGHSQEIAKEALFSNGAGGSGDLGASSISSNYTDNSDPHSTTLVQHHLKLLTSGTGIQFLLEISPGTYAIPFVTLTKQLKQYNFESLIKTTLGHNAFRVLRCLKSLKLGDEKAISNAVLLKEKTVRNEMYRLINANVVEIQEVPRSADRAASKTFYLFRYKEWPSYKFLLNSLIFNMAEILNNIQDFKSDYKILLEKCEREDVKGHEEELLLESELKSLHSLQNREIKNIGKFNRIKTLYDIYLL